ncbi:MAG: DUF4314 domain-containing protein [Ruminococcus sp.]|nr:DUF4314 domain-containing protein [Ruminococcus sp.]
MGEVIDVDNIGTVHVAWLTGGTLDVAYGEDENTSSHTS